MPVQIKNCFENYTTEDYIFVKPEDHIWNATNSHVELKNEIAEAVANEISLSCDSQR